MRGLAVDFLPIFMNVQGQNCLVIGGGKIASRKVFMLLRAGAAVSVVSPELCQDLTIRKNEAEITHIDRAFEDADLAGCKIVIAATDDNKVNIHVSELAKAKGIPVNVVDEPALCSFIVPSIIDRNPVQIAISTGGASPVLARLLRSRLETFIPSSYGRLATLLESFREKVKAKFSNSDDIRTFWEQIVEGPVAENLIAGKDKTARELLVAAVENAEAPAERGEVYLVGAGPGDPDLLTFRALRLMQQADVVVYDRLVSQGVLDLVRRDAEMIYAGEEIETLTEENVSFQVVPGITAAAGCSSYAGIPLTHRDYVQSCMFVTGHLKDGSTDLNWDAVAQPNQTVVFYMGLQTVKELCKELVAHGLPSTTPAALVEKGTTQEQRVHIGDLTTLHDIVEKNNVKAPTLIIVGEVVKLHDKLNWFVPEGIE